MKYYNEREETIMRFFAKEIISIEHLPVTNEEKDQDIEKLINRYLNEMFSYRKTPKN